MARQAQNKETETTVTTEVQETETKTPSTTKVQSTATKTIYDEACEVGIKNPESYPEDILKNEIKMRDMVTIKLPKDNFMYKYDVLVSNPITGKMMKIKRGEPVQVPRCVKEILDEAKQQNDIAYVAQTEMAENFSNAEQNN